MRIRRRHAPSSGSARRIVFFHIPKCAGTSLNRQMRDALGIRTRKWYYLGRRGAVWINRNSGEDTSERAVDAHRAAFLYGHFGIDFYRSACAPRGDDFLFTFLRDPRERLLSHFRFVRARRARPASTSSAAPGSDLTLSDFLLEDKGAGPMDRDNPIVRYLADDNTSAPRDDVDWAEMVESAKSNLHHLDFVGFSSRYDSDAARLLTRLGGSPVAAKRLNVTPRPAGQADPVTRGLTPEIERAIERYTRHDRVLYDFAKAEWG